MPLTGNPVSEEVHRPAPLATSSGTTRQNYAVPWMIYFQFFAIFVYMICFDTRSRHYMSLANKIIPMSFLVLCGAIVYARLMHDHLLFWTPLTWFFLTSALLFGMAPLIYFYGSDYSIRFLDTYYIIDEQMLLRTNLLNSVGTLVTCLAHSFAGYFQWRPRGKRYEVEDTTGLANRVFWTLLVIAFPLKYLVFVPIYLELFDFIVPATVQNIANLLGTCISLAFFILFSGRRRFIWIAVSLLLIDIMASTLTFSKSSFILPIIQATMGIYLCKRSITPLVIGLLLAILAYMWIKPLVDMGRSEFFKTGKSAIGRVEMVEKYFKGELHQSEAEAQANSQHWWLRQSFSNIQGYMINAYDSGVPGATISDFWVVLIPRTLWPDKPNLSLAGTNLNKLIVGSDQSSLGGTLYGEAYWNGGWPVVIFVSAFIGVLFYVLGSLSSYYLEVMDLRYLPLASMGIFYGLNLEGWFVLAYVGTIPLFIAIWYLIKIIVPMREAR